VSKLSIHLIPSGQIRPSELHDLQHAAALADTIRNERVWRIPVTLERRLPLKMIWALLDLMTIVVLLSGLYRWWKKRALSAEQLIGETEPDYDVVPASASGVIAR